MQRQQQTQKAKNHTYHLFTDGEGFFAVQKGNKTIYEDKPNTAYRKLVDTRFFEEFCSSCLADWVIELQDNGTIGEDFTLWPMIMST